MGFFQEINNGKNRTASTFQKGEQDRADADDKYGGQEIYPQGQCVGCPPGVLSRAASETPAPPASGAGGNGAAADRASPLGKQGFLPGKPAGRAPDRLK